jgi:hypothetical protein
MRGSAFPTNGVKTSTGAAMPMRSEIHVRESKAQREATQISEVLIVVIFCLAGFAASIFAAEHSAAFNELGLLI